jgi:type III restriction enzyme
VNLRENYADFDFRIPLVIREQEEELRAPSIDPATLPVSKFPLHLVKITVGKGDRFISEDAQTGTQYGDYRIDGGVMTATGYNDYLSRMTTRIAEALGSGITKSAKQYREISKFPLLQAYRPLLTGWIDTYIRLRLFGEPFDPLHDEDWRVLLIDDVSHSIAGVFATALTEAAVNQSTSGAEVSHRRLSEVRTISVRASSAVAVEKCIYPQLPIPTRAGGLERLFIGWADDDTAVEALAKIHEYRHDFLHRPYLKADGMPAYYSPDFIVRTKDDVYIVETKAQSAVSDENVQRKQRAALSWIDQLNALDSADRDERGWHYVLLGERTIEEWKANNARASELLEFARLRRHEAPTQGTLVGL